MSNKFVPFSPRQKTIISWWSDKSKYKDWNGIIADGSIRSGKSTAMAIGFFFWAMSRYNERNFAICGVTIAALRRNIINDTIITLERHGYKVLDRRGASLLIVSKGDVKNKFYLFSGYDERSQDSIQGITLAGVYFDEVALMPQSFVNQATGRCSVEGAKYWFNCNPAGSRMHWFKTNWINVAEQKKILYLHFTMDDNYSLSEGVKQKYMSMYTGVFYRRYIEGRWVAAEGAIYDMWDRKLNIYDLSEVEPDYVDRYSRYVAIDYGTANPMVFLDTIDDGTKLWIRNEYYYDSKRSENQRSKTDSQYADDFEAFVDHDHSVTVIIDPSAMSFREELRTRGYRVKEANNEVLDGIRVTSTMIKQRRLKILRGQCPNLEREIESYVWDEKAIQRGEEAPVKQNDHAMDAMRYLCKTLMTRRRLAR